MNGRRKNCKNFPWKTKELRKKLGSKTFVIIWKKVFEPIPAKQKETIIKKEELRF